MTELPTVEREWRCETCRFFGPDENEKTPTGGMCHRYPPKIHPGHLESDGPNYHVHTTFMWPEVENDDWCGEWEAKPSSEPITDRCEISRLWVKRGLSIRTAKVLAKLDIYDPKQLIELSDDKFLEQRNAGLVSLREMRKFQEAYGFIKAEKA